jgi:hypothetical protein
MVSDNEGNPKVKLNVERKKRESRKEDIHNSDAESI